MLRQRKYSIDAANKLDENGNRPPEVRLGKISSDGRVRLEFTNAMNFPSFEEFLEMNNKSGDSRLLQDSSKAKLIELMVYKGDEDV